MKKNKWIAKFNNTNKEKIASIFVSGEKGLWIKPLTSDELKKNGLRGIGKISQAQTILKHLDKLTDKKLDKKYNSRLSEYRVYETGEETVELLENGTELISKLIISDTHKIIIIPARINTGSIRSTGSELRVTYNYLYKANRGEPRSRKRKDIEDREQNNGIRNQYKRKNAEDPNSETGREPEIGLAHELIHVKYCMKNTDDENKEFNKFVQMNDPDNLGNPVSLNFCEITIRKEENLIRLEQLKKAKPKYTEEDRLVALRAIPTLINNK